MDIKNFKEEIKPFFLVEQSGSYSVCLTVGEYKNALFNTRADEGFDGNGYDWTSLARVFLAENMNELLGIINFDSESSMFCAYSENKEALQNFIISFKNSCENEELIQELFLRAELD